MTVDEKIEDPDDNVEDVLVSGICEGMSMIPGLWVERATGEQPGARGGSDEKRNASGSPRKGHLKIVRPIMLHVSSVILTINVIPIVMDLDPLSSPQTVNDWVCD